MQALPLLAQINLADALKKVELEFALIPQKIPALAEATDKLMFGLQLMADLVEKLLAANPDVTNKIPRWFSEKKCTHMGGNQTTGAGGQWLW